MQEDHTNKQYEHLRLWGDSKHNYRVRLLEKGKIPRWASPKKDPIFRENKNPFGECDDKGNRDTNLEKFFGKYENKFFPEMRSILRNAPEEVYKWIDTNKQIFSEWIVFSFGRQSSIHIKKLLPNGGIEDNNHEQIQLDNIECAIKNIQRGKISPLAAFQLIYNDKEGFLLGDQPCNAFFKENNTCVGGSVVWVPMNPTYGIRLFNAFNILPNEMEKIINANDNDWPGFMGILNAEVIKSSVCWAIGKHENSFDNIIEAASIKTPFTLKIK